MMMMMMMMMGTQVGTAKMFEAELQPAKLFRDLQKQVYSSRPFPPKGTLSFPSPHFFGVKMVVLSYAAFWAGARITDPRRHPSAKPRMLGGGLVGANQPMHPHCLFSIRAVHHALYTSNASMVCTGSGVFQGKWDGYNSDRIILVVGGGVALRGPR